MASTDSRKALCEADACEERKKKTSSKSIIIIHFEQRARASGEDVVLIRNEACIYLTCSLASSVNNNDTNLICSLLIWPVGCVLFVLSYIKRHYTMLKTTPHSRF